MAVQSLLVVVDGKPVVKAAVPVPGERGRYMLTHRCVIEAACPACGASIGVPCLRSGGRYVIGPHYKRVHAARDARRGSGSNQA